MSAWSSDDIDDLRDYVALGYTVDFIAAITGRDGPDIERKIVDLGLGMSSKPDVAEPAPAPAARKHWDRMTVEERIVAVAAMRADGVPYSEIGRTLHTGKSAIAGYVNRYPDRFGPVMHDDTGGPRGKREKAAPKQQPPRVPKQPKPKAVATARIKPVPLPPEPILPPDPAAAIPLFEAVGKRRCHYPLWGNALPAPNMLDGLCCGMPAPEGRSYCAHHHAEAHSTRSLAPISESGKSMFFLPKRRVA